IENSRIVNFSLEIIFIRSVYWFSVHNIKYLYFALQTKSYSKSLKIVDEFLGGDREDAKLSRSYNNKKKSGAPSTLTEFCRFEFLMFIEQCRTVVTVLPCPPRGSNIP